MQLCNLTDDQVLNLNRDLQQALVELVDRRAAEVSEHRALERSLAYEYACSVIDSCCAAIAHMSGSDCQWYDTLEVDPDSAGAVEDALLYLETRGLLWHHESYPSYVFLRDESEAA